MRPMSRPLLFRLFLVLALLCNGLATAHAAVGHALMAMPVQEADMQDCHDMAGHHDESPASSEHGKAACCQGNVCNCACAMPLPANLTMLALPSSWPSQPLLSAPDRYRSIDAALILRPPIA